MLLWHFSSAAGMALVDENCASSSVRAGGAFTPPGVQGRIQLSQLQACQTTDGN